MYTKTVPHKNFAGKVRNQEVQFNLTEHEVLKLLVEFKAIFDWQDKISKEENERELDTVEVIEFYNHFEEILLSAWGELSDDGDHFRKGGRYEFAESSVFHAAMKLFLEDRDEANKLLDGLMPKGLQDLVKAADPSLAELAKKSEGSGDSADLQAKVAELEARLAGENTTRDAS